MKFPLKKILSYGILILLGILTVGLVLKLLMNLESIAAGISGMVGALRAIVLGCVMAYLLYPLTKFTEQYLLYRGVRKKAARSLSTGFSTFVLMMLIVLFIYFVVPELVENLPGLIQDLPWMIRDTFNQITHFLEAQGLSTDLLQELSTKLTNSFNTWLAGDPLSDLVDLMGRVMDVAKGLLNFVIGIIVMVYVLNSRDQFVGQGKKFLFAMCRKQENCDTILKHLRVINQIFSGFVSGKLLDSLIIGIICGVVLSLLNIPYTMLISVIVGITNIIPVFGPFFGAIPSAFLLLLTDPGKCLVFIVFIIILQQIDGNIIGPKILGDSTGLPAFWVLFSLLLFNHIMGFWGMLLGVPLFASFYYLVREFISARLRRKHLPEDTANYINAAGVDEDGNIYTMEPAAIQFRPLFTGEDSYWKRALDWLRRMQVRAEKQVGPSEPPDRDRPDDPTDP